MVQKGIYLHARGHRPQKDVVIDMDTFKGSFNCRFSYAVILAAMFVCTTKLSMGQAAPAPQPEATASLAESLQLADTGKIELRILYIHGMGVNEPKAGTQDFEVSQNFRASFCRQIRCTADEFVGRQYAEAADFAPEVVGPPLSYLGEDLWRESRTNAHLSITTSWCGKMASSSTLTKSIGGRRSLGPNAGRSLPKRRL